MIGTIQKEPSCLVVTSNTLQQSQGIADSVRGCGGQLAWVEQWIDRDDLLQQTGHDTKAVPQNQSQFGYLFALLAEFHEGSLSS
jgi:hypothetical protein